MAVQHHPMMAEQTPSRINVLRIVQGLALSTAIGGLAYKRGSLSESGWLGAVVTGTPTFGFGGWDWGMTLITFFVSSTVLSHYKESVKQQKTGKKFDKGARRDIVQALANGGAGALLALAYGILDEPTLLKAVYLGINATATADTWATELGVLSDQPPRLITTLQVVEPGTSGAITPAGTAASAAGGLFIGLAMLGFTKLFKKNQSRTPVLWMLPAGLVGGLAGSLSDSLMSATVQVAYQDAEGNETERATASDGTPHTYVRGVPWFTNDMVNFTSTLTGALGAAAVYWLLGRK